MKKKKKKKKEVYSLKPEIESVGVIDKDKKNNNPKPSPSICQNAHASPVQKNTGQKEEWSKKGNGKTQADAFV